MADPLTPAILRVVGVVIAGQSVGVSMIHGALTYLGLANRDLVPAPETLLHGLLNGYTLLAISLFILAAGIMGVDSLTDRLLRFCQA